MQIELGMCSAALNFISLFLCMPGIANPVVFEECAD